MNHSDKRRPSFVQRTSSDLDSLLYANYGKTARYSVKTESGLVELDLKFDSGMICVTNARITIDSKVIEKSRIFYTDYIRLKGSFSNLNSRVFPDCFLGYDTPISLARSIDRILNSSCRIQSF